MSKFNSIFIGVIATAFFAFVSHQQIELHRRSQDPKKGVKNIVLVHGHLLTGRAGQK